MRYYYNYKILYIGKNSEFLSEDEELFPLGRISLEI